MSHLSHATQDLFSLMQSLITSQPHWQGYSGSKACFAACSCQAQRLQASITQVHSGVPHETDSGGGVDVMLLKMTELCYTSPR